MDLTTNQKKFVIILSIALGILIVIMAFLTNYWFSSAIPMIPDHTSTPTRSIEVVEGDLDNYKTVLAIIKDNKSYLNKLLVTDFAAPLFKTLIGSTAGYILLMPLIQALVIRIKGNRAN